MIPLAPRCTHPSPSTALAPRAWARLLAGALSVGILQLSASGCAGPPAVSVAPTTPASPARGEPDAGVRETTSIEVHLTRMSFANLHVELEAMLLDAFEQERRRCPSLAFRFEDGGSNFSVEHWVYEAARYLLVFVQTEYPPSSEQVDASGHRFVLWPESEGRGMRGATLVLGRSDALGTDDASVRAAVRVAVRHAVREIALVHGAECRP